MRVAEATTCPTCARADCPPAHHPKLQMLTRYCQRHHSSSVPDPYYGGEAGFEQVLDLVEDACDGLITELGKQLA